MTPQEAVERALAAARCDDCVVIAEEMSSANLRWAGNTLSTNGVARSRRLTVVAISRASDGTRAGVVSRAAAVTSETIGEIVAAAEEAAAQSSPAEDARALLGPGDREAFGMGKENAPSLRPAWDDVPASTGISAFGGVPAALGAAFDAAATADRRLYGFASHTMTSTFLGTSRGLRLRYDQPEGKVEMNAKSGDLARSAWAGQATRDFTDVDVAAMSEGLASRLGWQRRQLELPAGRYDTLLPPSAMADLYVSLYWSAGARDAQDGRSSLSKPGGGTRLGEQLASLPVTLRSDPGAHGLACAPFVVTHASGRNASVFDNGLAIQPAAWLRDGVLTSLVQTRYTAQRSGDAVTPATGNLIFEGPPGSEGSLDDLIASTQRGLLLTSLWYIRMVDPQTMLLTGLTRDGVYLVENGEVSGAVNNFRFNESPLGMLGRLAETGGTVPALPREWGEDFTRAAMPPARVADFHMSSVSGSR